MSATVFEGPLGPALAQVISGGPAPEELAAVAALLTARPAAARRRPPLPAPAAGRAGRTRARSGGPPPSR